MGIGYSQDDPIATKAEQQSLVRGSPSVSRRGSQETPWKPCNVGKEINYTVSGRGDAVSVVRSFKSTSCGEWTPPSTGPPSTRSSQQVRGTPCIDVVNTDMPQERQEYAIDVMMKAVRTVKMFRDVAEFVKKEMDIKFGSAWQCVVGREFGINISHMYGYFLFVTLDSMAILLYKTD